MTTTEVIMALHKLAMRYKDGGNAQRRTEAEMHSAIEALVRDGERYRWLRSNQMQYSLANDTVAMLVADATTLDGAIAVQEVKHLPADDTEGGAV